MTIKHHISDELLLEYATGALEEGWSMAVATHLALCPHCRQRLSCMEDTGGALLEALPNAASASDDSWAALKARLNAPKPAPKSETVPKASSPVFPQPLRDYIGADMDQLKWKPLGLGAYHYPIRTGNPDIYVRLLRIPAGKPVPEHSHRGRELTLVLKGSFRDHNGHFGRGDFEETDETIEHQPIASAGEDCICLAVTDAPLRFKSRIVRFIQPILGI